MAAMEQRAPEQSGRAGGCVVDEPRRDRLQTDAGIPARQCTLGVGAGPDLYCRRIHARLGHASRRLMHARASLDGSCVFPLACKRGEVTEYETPLCGCAAQDQICAGARTLCR